MKRLISTGLIVSALSLTFAFAPFANANTVSQIQIANTIVANQRTDFYVTLSEVLPNASMTSKVVIIGASASDINALEYWNGSAWTAVSLAPNAQGELTASNSFVSSTMNYRIAVRTQKSYVLGYSLENSLGQVVSSAAVPFNVIGGAVLGQYKYTFNWNLSYGMKNNDVMELQKVLADQGLLTATPNGQFGPATLAAVKAYQKSVGVSATGYVGPATRAALNR